MSEVRFTDGVVVADYSSPYIVAEVNSSHNGNADTAKKMIDAAVKAGCSCVKFQSWSAESLYSKTYYKQNPIAKRIVNKFSMSSETLKEMAEYCAQAGVAFSSTPYSCAEVDFLVDECKAPFIKIASMEVNNYEFLRYIAKKQIPIVLSTGMSDFNEVAKAIRIIEDSGNRNIVILHCVSVYPTPIDKVNLNNILSLRKLFPNYPIGFSDHTIGDEAAIAATALGAALIEKHITLDASKLGMDNQMAMEPDDLKELVKKCKAVSGALGDGMRTLLPEEIKQRENMRRSIVVTRDIKAGEVLSKEDLDVKRPGTGISPTKIDLVVGCTVKNDIESDTVVKYSDLDIDRNLF
jgi:N-acetylneuraminate synthase